MMKSLSICFQRHPDGSRKKSVGGGAAPKGGQLLPKSAIDKLNSIEQEVQKLAGIEETLETIKVGVYLLTYHLQIVALLYYVGIKYNA